MSLVMGHIKDARLDKNRTQSATACHPVVLKGTLISVIIPVLNRPLSAERAVWSVLNQQGMGLDTIEVMVVDDGSQPPLALSIDDPRLKVLRLDKNAGPSGARNAGIKASSGELIAFLDSDDVWLSHKLSSQMQYFRQLQGRYGRETLFATTCGFYYPNHASGKLQARIPKPANLTREFASGCWCSPGSTQLTFRTIYDTVGMLDETLRRLEDLDWFIRFGLKGGRLFVCPHIGAVIAPSNSASFQTVMASTKILEAKFSNHGELPLPPGDLSRLQAYIALERGAALLTEKKRRIALWYMLASFLYKPRWQASVERFWERSDAIPVDVQRLYSEIAHN